LRFRHAASFVHFARSGSVLTTRISAAGMIDRHSTHVARASFGFGEGM
jgi:hypothetical protein